MEPHEQPVIRKAVENDVPRITTIYNEAVEHTTATFDTMQRSVEDRVAWFRSHGAKHPVLVAEKQGMIAGWASLSPWSDRCAYETTAEVSLYVHSEYRGRGIGKALFSRLVEAADAAGMHCLLARIAEGNKASVNLHESFGFRTVGVMHEVGFKFGRFLDVTLMERLKPEPPEWD
jgi:phosphinothricin acetyltransferase